MNTLSLCQWMMRLTHAGLKGDSSDCAPPGKLDQHVWGDLYEISHKHGLVPLVHAGILACHLTPPGPIAAQFVKYVRAAELRAQQAFDQLREISVAFDQEKIDLIALKGVPFAFRYYATPGLRRFGDIDTLARAAQLDSAGAVIERLGYTCIDSHEAEKPSFYLDHPMKYHTGYERGSGFPVELHWNLVPARSPVQFDLDGLWERSYVPDQAKDLGRALAFEDEAVFLAVHMARHEFLMPARAFVDLALLLSATPGYDCAKLWRRAGECKAQADLAAALAVTEKLGLAALPAELAQNIARETHAAGLDPVKLSRYVLTWPKFEYADRAVDALT
ncbi:MAG TPA: nucleotidyltransferase family protein, partial [Capsulimonadaceae bacterium]|nr:nucleotidyltransferase family protein [Capsulimonadaceae bacterium]